MTELILGAIILALVFTNIYLYSRMIDMTKEYMRAFMARNLTELTQNDILKKVDPNPPPKEEFIPVEDADESIFKKVLQNINGGQNFSSEV